MSYFLGVDGGQSSTTALIGDDTGRVVGFGRGGPCNHVGAAEGAKKFVHAIRGCVGAACDMAGLDANTVEFRAACLGLSGGPADKETLLRGMLRTDRLVVTHDAQIALTGATGGEPGVVVIAGTGSIAFGQNRAGRTARAGGWGYVFGDEGGGFDLTRQALRASLRQEEGWGPPTALRAMILCAAGSPSADQLLHRFYTSEFSRPQIAGFAGIVNEAALEGDTVAQKLLTGSAQELAVLANAVRRQLFEEGETVLVTYIGGVFRSEILRERFRVLMDLDGGVQVTAPMYGPGAGALIEAYRAAGVVCMLSQVPEIEK